MSAPKLQISATQAEWVSLLSKVNSAAEKAAAIPILSCVKLFEQAGMLHASCTDLTMTLSAKSTIAVPTDFAVAINEHKLMGLCKLYSPDTVLRMTVEFDRDRVLLQAGKSRSSLDLLSAQDFPAIARADSEFEFSCEVPVGWWPTAMRYTEPFLAIKDNRVYLNGLRFQAKQAENTLLLTASDGRRLSLFQDSKLIQPPSKNWDTILPRAALAEISRLVAQNPTGNLTLQLSPAQLKVGLGDTLLYANLIEGVYPEVSRLIPSLPAPSKAVISTTELQTTLKRFSVLYDPKSTAAVFTFKAGELFLRAHTTQALASTHQESHDELEVDYTGPDLVCAYNVGFLQDALKTIQADTVELHNFDPVKPLRLVDPSDSRVTQLIMPVRI